MNTVLSRGIIGKSTVFRADTAGFGKYHKGSYGQIMVYRMKIHDYKFGEINM